MFLQLQGQDSAVVDALRRGDLAAAPVSPAERELLALVELLTLHAYRCQPQMPPDVHGHFWIRVSRACASSGLL